jgi:hypothetical protein
VTRMLPTGSFVCPLQRATVPLGQFTVQVDSSRHHAT